MSAFLPLLAAQNSMIFWYLFPLAAVVSLVYNASRFEIPEVILRRAARLFATILLFMGAVLLILLVFSRGL